MDLQCTNCGTAIPDQSKFCFECGTKVIQETLNCPDCHAENLLQVKFCKNCGFNFDGKERINNLFEKVPQQELAEEISDSFFEHLKYKIEQEQDGKLYEEYAKRYHQSDFKYSFEAKSQQLAAEVTTQRLSPDYQPNNTRNFLLKTYEGLSDLFIIHHCADINPVPLSEKILQYAEAKKEDINMLQVIEDYLSLDDEKGVIHYTNFIEMPLERLKTAGKSFLFPEKDEKILLICDQSVTGSLKEGFAFTESAFYWRMHFEPARKVLFENLNQIVKEQDWIIINGNFFNADKSLNTKILKVLKKIKYLYL